MAALPTQCFLREPDIPIHRQPAFADLGLGPGSFPVTESAATTQLSLPLFPGITEAQQEQVVETLVAAVS